jgi:hypothetical protein
MLLDFNVHLACAALQAIGAWFSLPSTSRSSSQLLPPTCLLAPTRLLAPALGGLTARWHFSLLSLEQQLAVLHQLVAAVESAHARLPDAEASCSTEPRPPTISLAHSQVWYHGCCALQLAPDSVEGQALGLSEDGKPMFLVSTTQLALWALRI